jgi:hypothetical protein
MVNHPNMKLSIIHVRLLEADKQISNSEPLMKSGGYILSEEDEERGEDRIRKMAELRMTLEKRVKELQTELEQLRALLDFVNSALLEKGFKKPEIKPTASAPIAQEPALPQPPEEETVPPEREHAQAIPIKTATGELLANLYTDDDSMRVVLAHEKQFTVDTPPFMAFLVERVLAKMQEKDRESASAGEIPPDRILSYEIVKDGDVVRELIVKNIGEDRGRELRSTIRWTLEKMYEKMKSTVSS